MTRFWLVVAPAAALFGCGLSKRDSGHNSKNQHGGTLVVDSPTGTEETKSSGWGLPSLLSLWGGSKTNPNGAAETVGGSNEPVNKVVAAGEGVAPAQTTAKGSGFGNNDGGAVHAGVGDAKVTGKTKSEVFMSYLNPRSYSIFGGKGGKSNEDESGKGSEGAGTSDNPVTPGTGNIGNPVEAGTGNSDNPVETSEPGTGDNNNPVETVEPNHVVSVTGTETHENGPVVPVPEPKPPTSVGNTNINTNPGVGQSNSGNPTSIKKNITTNPVVETGPSTDINTGGTPTAENQSTNSGNKPSGDPSKKNKVQNKSQNTKNQTKGEEGDGDEDSNENGAHADSDDDDEKDSALRAVVPGLSLLPAAAALCMA